MPQLTIVVHVWIHVAPIKLEIIHVPVSKRLRIELHVIQTTWIPGTRLCAGVFVDPKLQALCMNLNQSHVDRSITTV